jgi:hypothetical protein
MTAHWESQDGEIAMTPEAYEEVWRLLDVVHGAAMVEDTDTDEFRVNLERLLEIFDVPKSLLRRTQINMQRVNSRNR